jgi:hypothetical protein
MDTQTTKYSAYKKDILKYICTFGAGLSLGYFFYRKYLSNKTKDLCVESLSTHEANERSKYIKDVKYDISFKLLYQENMILHSINHALVKSSVRGYLELEFNLSEHRDVYLEFSGILLSLKKYNSDDNVPYEYFNKNHRIIIKKEGLVVGKNKFCFTFTHANCDKGIFYSEKVKLYLNLSYKIYLLYLL